jgi:heparin binding hemagglutinin HbhA
MTEQTRTRIPAPLYAAAGAGDLAYRQLRKLPAAAAATLRAATVGGAELREKAAAGTTDLRGKVLASTADLRERAIASTVELREKTTATVKAANTTANDLRDRAAAPRSLDLDVERLRELARRNAAAFVAGAQAAQEKAIAVYAELVTRGERVIGGGILEVADTVNTDLEITADDRPATPANPAATAKAAKAPGKATRSPATAAKSAKAAKSPARTARSSRSTGTN